MIKKYYVQYDIGKAKYVVNHYNGVKTHSDGSAFYDIAIFKSKRAMHTFIDKLEAWGYKEVAV